VPVCPLCSKPVPSVKGQEDRSVSEHIDRECKQDTKIYTNACSLKNCKRKELVPFKCGSCNQNFCLKHRHHECVLKQSHPRDVMAQAALRRLDNDHFSRIQGQMSEDEALAHALSASIQTTPQQQQQPVAAGTAGEKKCLIS